MRNNVELMTNLTNIYSCMWKKPVYPCIDMWRFQFASSPIQMYVTVGRDRLCLILLHVVMPPIARGQTWLFQPLPVSTVPNTGRNQSDSGYRGLDEEEEFARYRLGTWTVTSKPKQYKFLIRGMPTRLLFITACNAQPTHKRGDQQASILDLIVMKML